MSTLDFVHHGKGVVDQQPVGEPVGEPVGVVGGNFPDPKEVLQQLDPNEVKVSGTSASLRG